jgi:general L-amino acid transport system permease protein
MSTQPELPPSRSLTPWDWARQNLFDSWYNTILSLLCLVGIIAVGQSLIRWIFTTAKWTVVQQNLALFLVGRYPQAFYWRLWLMVVVFGVAIALVLGRRFLGQRTPLVLSIVLPLALVVMLWLIGGGWGLAPVSTTLWNGLMLTLLLASVSIVLAFPIGVLLALGRQSSLPLLSNFSRVYIELIRGLPLIGILFMAQVMLPLVLPSEIRLDRLLRAIAGLVLFNAAYLAENVRGGLQTVPRGQTEAAKAIGLNLPLTLILIVLPQALRVSIPAIVGQFISLFKDTSLLSLFALVELTGISRSVLSQPEFLGDYAEVYLFIGFIYWAFCYGMSRFSRRFERLGS